MFLVSLRASIDQNNPEYKFIFMTIQTYLFPSLCWCSFSLDSFVLKAGVKVLNDPPIVE